VAINLRYMRTEYNTHEITTLIILGLEYMRAEEYARKDNAGFKAILG
jgi:hypothetical protein